MTAVSILIVLTLICGFYVAWNIGANDVANAMGTSVGSGALTLTSAVILASIFEFAGAYLVGANVTDTVRNKMFETELITQVWGDKAPYILACGMIASLIAAGTWLLIATLMTWPVSTTHSIVGAVVGFGIVALGFEGIYWDKVGLITCGWIVSPLISASIAYFLFGIVLQTVFHKKDPVAAAVRITPLLVFVSIFVLSGVTTFKGLQPFWRNQGVDEFDPSFIAVVLAITVGVGIVAMFVARWLLRNYNSGSRVSETSNPVLDADISRSIHKAEMHLTRVRNHSDGEIQQQAGELLKMIDGIAKIARRRVTTNAESDDLKKVEKIFVLLQIITACLVAFAHGANDVANAVGPLSAAYQALTEGEVTAKSTTPSWALLLGGVGIVVGLATLGWRVIQTVGSKITELTPTRGFCAEFATALTILAASTLPIGLPVSTTHTLVGAVLGVGLARGINALNLKTMRDIVAGWVITIPAGAGLSIIFYYILKAIFVDSGWV